MLINKDIKLDLMLSFMWIFNDYFYYKLFKYLSIKNKNKDDTSIFFFTYNSNDFSYYLS